MEKEIKLSLVEKNAASNSNQNFDSFISDSKQNKPQWFI